MSSQASPARQQPGLAWRNKAAKPGGAVIIAEAGTEWLSRYEPELIQTDGASGADAPEAERQ